MTITIIGTGLIGGSLALDLKAKGFCSQVIGVDKNERHLKDALMLGLIDEAMEMDKAIRLSDLVIVAVPVNVSESLLPKILNKVKEGTVVTDTGSTKKAICDAVKNHPKRNQFVAAHPIAGTENSGPKAAIQNLFDRKMGIICDKELSDKKAVELVKKMYETVNTRLLYMDSDSHDMHVAYVSHISHITSFVLATTVLDIEKNTTTIFNLAGSGFASTVRLAKSSPDMWAPIFVQNSKYISQALGAYINEMTRFKKLVDNGDQDGIYESMKKANEIRRILEGIK